VEAAVAGGLPVQFDVLTPMSADWEQATDASDDGLRTAQIVLLVVVLLIVVGAVFLAARNRNLGRGDLRGAFRIAGVVVGGRLLVWLFTAHHVASLGGEFYIFGAGLGFALLLGLGSWLFYMAIEPYARKLWPQSLVGWSRILAGRVRDPLVGRELLVGAAFGAAFAVIVPLRLLVPEWLGLPSPPPPTWGLEAVRGGRFTLGLMFAIPVSALASPLANYLLLLILRIVLRLPWLAVIGFTAVSILGDTQSLITADGSGPSLPMIGIGVLFGILDAVVLLTLMLRFGLLATAGCFVVVQSSMTFPWTLDAGLPYFGSALVGMAVPLAFTAWAFFVATSGRTLFRDHLLESEFSRP
jgi:serine/threonine-protein kinase